MSDIEPEGPKYRLEHAPTAQATCQQAACKRAGSKIAKGELRIGTHTLFNRDEEIRWYMAWRHWACATKHQINGLKEITDNDPTKAPGYEQLSPESQEQVKLALESGHIVDKSFKDIRPDLAGTAPSFDGEITDAEAYKIDMPTRAAKCRASGCAAKITKGELRVGFLRSFDGDHSSWVYKHWNCISKHDISALKNCYERDDDIELEGYDGIPSQQKQAVQETFQTGKLASVSKVDPIVKTTKSQRRNPGPEQKDDTSADAPKPRRSGRKRTAAYVEAESDGELEYVPKKSARRRTSDV